MFVSYGALSGTMFVSYGALSGTMFVSYGALSGTISDRGVFVSHGALSDTMFVSYEALSGTISDCGVTSGALSGTNASTTGLQNLMETTPGHEQPQSRGAKQSSYPPFITY
jgi:hypothetical protein